MPCELGLRFDDPARVVVFLNEDGEIQFAPAQPFTGPLDQKAQRDLEWYLEVYPVQYTTEIDDERRGDRQAHPGLGRGAVQYCLR
jgi:hypothetical protein